jgi:hypothetical protein
MRKYESVPHPFIIEPPPETKRIYKPGEVIEFTLVLISKALDYLPYFIYTFDQLGSMGIGKGRGKFELLSVHKLSSDVADEHAQEMIYSAETKTMKSFSPSQLHVSFNSSDHSERDTHLLSIDFLTPTKIIYQGNPTTDLEFHIFMRQLLRRVSLLAYFHSGIDTTTWDFRGIIDQSEKVKIKENNLKWYDWQRYSSRQNSKINMGGITGNISYEGILAPFKTLIKAGEILHIGKGTTFGQGKYRIIKMEEFH